VEGGGLHKAVALGYWDVGGSEKTHRCYLG